MDACVWVCVRVRGWAAKEGILSLVFSPASDCLKGTPLS